MQKERDRQYYFFVYILFAAFFFISGNVICFLFGNYAIYREFEMLVTECVNSACPLSFSSVISSYIDELKLPLFAVMAAFTSKRRLLLCLAVSYKGFVCGMCSACFMRILKNNVLSARFEVFGAFIFNALQICIICLLCFFCAHTLIFSRKTVFPPKFAILFRQKNTYRFLVDVLVMCGILFVIIFLKHGNLNLMISSKGM